MGINDGMKTSQFGLEFITKWEGCVLKPYRDIAGLRTIGVGHLIKPGESFPDGVEITKEKALELLASDVSQCENAIASKITVKLNQNQFDALVSFGFNCGVGVYSTSDACRSLNTGDYAAVPEKLLAWSKAKINGVLQVNKGLYNRRKSEGELFVRDVDDSSVVAPQVVVWNADTIKIAQSCLKTLGLYSLKVDGLWGPGTANGLVTFAKNNGLTVGVDPRTSIPFDLYARLQEAAKAK
jgi:lysozyme